MALSAGPECVRSGAITDGVWAQIPERRVVEVAVRPPALGRRIARDRRVCDLQSSGGSSGQPRHSVLAMKRVRAREATAHMPTTLDQMLGVVERDRVTLRMQADRLVAAQRQLHRAVGVIGEADLQRLFQTFQQAADNRPQEPGTGLGLSIVKQIVEMHKGRIWMKSSGVPGDGTTFSFTLPVYEKQ